MQSTTQPLSQLSSINREIKLKEETQRHYNLSLQSEMATYRNVLLIGESRTLGSMVTKKFLNSPYEVTVLSRQQSSSKLPSSIRVGRADYDDPASLEAAMGGCDVVISMVGGAVADDQNRFIDAAVAAGDGHLGFDLVTKTTTLTNESKTEFTVSTLESVGEAMIKTLEHTDETSNNYVYTSLFNLYRIDPLSVLETIGGQDWTLKQYGSKDLIEVGHSRFRKGDYNGIGLLVRALVTEPVKLGDSRPGGLWDQELGME
ncbi:hypothetical protein G6011_09906 [Alternaria panax]|uniref:NAD(P)-binding domain-containing protein n=1 Tax=Alternaria panax TaxID=48097 RepID=A0AAD4FDG6_9PLEO|nr:hypothetical protein G6011_09906 [Alternaria panax]